MPTRKQTLILGAVGLLLLGLLGHFFCSHRTPRIVYNDLTREEACVLSSLAGHTTELLRFDTTHLPKGNSLQISLQYEAGEQVQEYRFAEFITEQPNPRLYFRIDSPRNANAQNWSLITGQKSLTLPPVPLSSAYSSYATKMESPALERDQPAIIYERNDYYLPDDTGEQPEPQVLATYRLIVRLGG